MHSFITTLAAASSLLSIINASPLPSTPTELVRRTTYDRMAENANIRLCIFPGDSCQGDSGCFDIVYGNRVGVAKDTHSDDLPIGSFRVQNREMDKDHEQFLFGGGDDWTRVHTSMNEAEKDQCYQMPNKDSNHVWFVHHD